MGGRITNRGGRFGRPAHAVSESLRFTATVPAGIDTEALEPSAVFRIVPARSSGPERTIPPAAPLNKIHNPQGPDPSARIR